MKKKQKFSALVIVLSLILSIIAPITSFADGTGSITIKPTSNVSIEGKTFKIYRILDAQASTVGDAITYSVPNNMKTPLKNLFNIDIDITDPEFNKTVVEKFAQLSPDQLREAANNLIATGEIPAENTISVEANSSNMVNGNLTIPNLPLGYYLIKDTSTVQGEDSALSTVMVDTNKNVEIVIKADKPTIEKKIDGDLDSDGNNDGLVDSNEVAIGDTVPYVIYTKVPNHVPYKNYRKFIIQDTMSKGLTFDKSSLEVTVVDGDQLNEGSDFVFKTDSLTDGTTIFQIEILNVKNYNVGDNIKVTYNATLNENAVIGIVGNPNDIKLIYSNNPDWEGDAENEPTGETPQDRVITYVTGIKVVKVDGLDHDKKLANAKFKVEGTRLNKVLVESKTYVTDSAGTFWKLKNGTYTTDNPNSLGMDQSLYEDINIKYKENITKNIVATKTGVTLEATSNSNGIIKFEGLAAGTYTITELIAPSGYNLLQDPITLVITCDFPETMTGDAQCTWTGTINGKPVNMDNENRLLEFTIENNGGTELPETGGVGTKMLYILGAIIAVGTGVVLTTRKIISSK